MVHEIWREYPEIEGALIETKKLMRKGIAIRIPEIEAKINEYIDAPGKYLRAGMSLMFFYLVEGRITKKAITYAASLEILHLATLIHDDVIDLADTRRGIEAMHLTQTNKIAVYAGDYLFSYSMRLIAELKDEVQLTQQNNWLLESIMSGELRQLSNTYNKNMTMVEYIRQIRGKTAMLFALSTAGGYFIASENAKETRIARLIGMYLGLAFQLQDDLIDYTLLESQSGKPSMQDVQNGIYTAPLIIAMERNKKVRTYISQNNDWDKDALIQLNEMIKAEKGHLEIERLINRYIDKTLMYLDKLSNSDYKVNIKALILSISNRQF